VLSFDTVFDVEVTPNRPDAMCHLGLARELSAGLGETVTPPQFKLDESLRSSVKVETRASVSVETDGCRRFTARVIENVVVAPSPDWMQRRLRAIGLRPINNIVDITNYVMWELGQPLHCFDYDKFVAVGGTPTAQVSVRMGRSGESLDLLDGTTIELSDRDMVVCAGDSPVSLGRLTLRLATFCSNVRRGTAS
jgi:phenylalanyl-tRNA synthetase beta chain